MHSLYHLAKYLVQRLMHSDPLHRATVIEALECAWIKSNADALEQAYQERVISSFNKQ